MMLLHSASGTSSVGVRLVVPAEFTRMSTAPNSAIAAASNASRLARFVTSRSDRQRFPARSFNVVGRRLDEFRAPPGGHDVRAGGGESLRNRQADARRAADHDGSFGSQIEWSVWHAVTLFEFKMNLAAAHGVKGARPIIHRRQTDQGDGTISM